MKLIFPISLIVVSGIIFFVITDPLFNEVKQLKTEVSTYSIALSNSNDLQDTRDSLLDVYKNINKSDKERLEHFLPSTINNIELILEIEKIANLRGMPIKNFKFEDDTSSGGTTNTGSTTNKNMIVKKDPSDSLPYGIFPMEFVVEGRYGSFISFLDDLEHNLRLVDVKSVAFSVPAPSTTVGDTTDKSIYSYTLKVDTYWLK